MARNKRSFPEILPQYSAGARFCYFLDLYTSSKAKYGRRNDSLDRHKRRLANQAHAGLISPIETALVVNSDNHNEVIASAINFLTNVAASERAKEIKVIKRYLEDIKKNSIVASILKSSEKGRDDLSNLITDLEVFSENPSSGIELKDFYSKLTLLINTIRNSIESFQERLNQLLDKNRSTTSDIRSDFFATRLGTDIDTLLRNLTGTVQREKETALSTRIVKLLTDYAKKHLSSNSIFLDNPVEVLIGMMIDFEKFLQKQFDSLGLDNMLKLEEMDIEKIFDQYIALENTFLDRIRQNNQEVLTTLKTIRTEMGISELSPREKKFEERETTLNKVKHSRKRSTNPRTRKAVNSVLKSAGRQEISSFMTWNVTTARNNRHGTIYELILPVLENAFKVGGHAATDVITVDIGSVNIDIDLKNMIREHSASIKSVIEQQAKLQRNDRKDDLIEQIQEMNTDIQNSIEDINKILKDNNIPEDVFLYHQSLKLYTQIEEHKTTQFHGREMQVYNLLDNLYSLDNATDLTLIDKDIMYGAIINLCELAIGHGSKSMIENYLSIFAGLLMFDDVQTMSWDIARAASQEINIGQAYNIHLYLVNDIYVPGSLVLTTISQALQEGYKHISAQNGAKVTIDTSEGNNEIQSYLNARASGTEYGGLSDWENEAEAIARGIKIQITFLSSFFSFLAEIQDYIQ